MQSIAGGEKMKIPIYQIGISDRRRKTEPDDVYKLANSISEVGLIHPILVDLDHTLIAGLHRLEAAKQLGWTDIECTVCDLDGLLAELAEIDENLIRRGLNCVDEGEQLARRKEIYEKLHPETRQGMRNGQTSKTAPGAVLETKSFTKDASEKLGMAPRTIRTKIQVAKKLTPEAKEIVRSHDIGIKSALKLTRLAPDQQGEAAAQLAAGEIRSVDQYRPVSTEPEVVMELTQSADAPGPPVVVPTQNEGYYATIRDSVNDLKDPNKDRSRTPETFLASVSFFLRRFCQNIAIYTGDEYAAVFPVLSREHLDQLQKDIHFVCTTLNDLYSEIERKSKT